MDQVESNAIAEICLGKENNIDKSKNNVAVSWKILERLTSLKEVNPFVTDAKGMYLRNVVLAGVFTAKTKEGKYLKKEIVLTEESYKTKMVECIDNIMFYWAKAWNTLLSTQPNESNIQWSKKRKGEWEGKKINRFKINRFPDEAQEIVKTMFLVNKRMLKSCPTIGTFGFFPREIMNIIIQYVLYNYVKFVVIADDRVHEVLNSVTIPFIKKIGHKTQSITSSIPQSSLQSSPQSSSSTIKPLFTNSKKRKVEIINDVVQLFSSQHKIDNDAKMLCQKLPSVIGIITASNETHSVSANIVNPNKKPFFMIGRVWNEEIIHNYPRRTFVRRELDDVDLDLKEFASSKKISRNHMKVRFNPFNRTLECYFMGLNHPKLNGEVVIKNKWVTLGNPEMMELLNDENQLAGTEKILLTFQLLL